MTTNVWVEQVSFVLIKIIKFYFTQQKIWFYLLIVSSSKNHLWPFELNHFKVLVKLLLKTLKCNVQKEFINVQKCTKVFGLKCKLFSNKNNCWVKHNSRVFFYIINLIKM